MGRIFSGIQPTSNLTLGNYLGAIKNWVTMQSEHDSIFCVVDMHAITVPQEPEALRKATYEALATYIACGIDPKKSTLFVQSHVPQHAELAWYLNCATPMGWLNRMTQFKDKAGKNRDSVMTGLYTYPVLMAADILIYHATHVPVGEDQKQHVELCRDIAISFNQRFEREVFTVPQPIMPKQGARIKSLRDGTKKMSKSDPSDMSRINLTDDADTIAKKIRKATSDADVLPSEVKGLESRPEAENLVTIYAALAETTMDKVLGEFAGQGFGVFKPALANLAVEKLAPITKRTQELLSDKGEIEAVMRQGRDKLIPMANKTLDDVKQAMGFVTL